MEKCFDGGNCGEGGYCDNCPHTEPASSAKSALLGANYNDNYMTDGHGQRWVKKEYAQTYADAAGSAQTELESLREEIRLLRCLEDSYDTKDKVMGEIFLKLNQLSGT